MAGKEIWKLLALTLFAAVIFIAGFLMGMAREEDAWQRAAIRNHVARWEKNRYTGEWFFLWRTMPPERNEQ
jgi:hypothetical protein